MFEGNPAIFVGGCFVYVPLRRVWRNQKLIFHPNLLKFR